MNQGLCWDTGDILDWGKAPGRAETSALWTPSSWKAPPCHDLLEEQSGTAELLRCRPGISDPWALSSVQPEPPAPKNPPLRPAGSLPDQAPKAWQASNPQALHNLHSTGLCPSGLHRPTWSPLCRTIPLRPAKLVIHRHSQSPPGHTLKACQASDPQVLHHLCSAGPCP
jgi:hypothetical protein